MDLGRQLAAVVRDRVDRCIQTTPRNGIAALLQVKTTDDEPRWFEQGNVLCSLFHGGVNNVFV